MLRLGLSLAMILGVVVSSLVCDGARVVAPLWDSVLIEGEVTDIGTDVDDSGRLGMLVENRESTAGEYTKVIFYLTDDTLIQTGNPAVSLSIEDLEVGANVRVWPRGTVIDTNPALAEAGRVEVFS